MSKLLDKLEKSSKGSPARLGFGPATRTEKPPSVLFVGALSRNHSKGAKLLAQGGADAALVRAPTADASEVKAAREALGEIPWGLWADRLEAEKVAALEQQGCDFLVLEVEQAPLEALQERDTARILVVRPDMEERLLRTLEDLPIDAFLLRLPEASSPVTLQQLMMVGVVRVMTSKYLLLEQTSLPTSQEVEALGEAGVDGLVVEAAAFSAQELSQFRQQLLGLPKKKPRGERMTPVLPRLGAGLRPKREEEEEEEEGEDEEF